MLRLRFLPCPGTALALLCFALCPAPGAAASPNQVPLRKVGDFHLKHARVAAAAVALGENIYVFGGSAPGAVTVVERFNTRTHEVVELTRAPRPRRFHEAIEHDGKIYLFGGQGYGLSGNPHEHGVEVYDPATNQVTQAAIWENPRSSAAAAKVGDKVWFFGGSVLHDRRRAQVNTTEFYDFATGRWSAGPNMPTPRESEAAQVGDFILIPGGFRGRRGVTEVEMFVPSDGSWRTLPPLSRRVSAHSLAFLGEHLFLFGDYDQLEQILAYNLHTRESLVFKAGLKGARHSTTVVVGDHIYVIGGNTTTESGTERDYIQVFALNPDYPDSR